MNAINLGLQRNFLEIPAFPSPSKPSPTKKMVAFPVLQINFYRVLSYLNIFILDFKN